MVWNDMILVVAVKCYRVTLDEVLTLLICEKE